MNDRDQRHAEHGKWQTWAGRAAALMLPLSVMACPGSLADPGEFTSGGSSGGQSSGASTCTNAAPMLLNKTCGIIPCHAGVGATAALDLSGASFDSLATQMSMDYPGQTILDPGHPELSALYNKLQANALGVSGQMPPGGLPSADIAEIGQWITNCYMPVLGAGSSGGGSSSSGGLGGSSSGSSGGGSTSSSGGLGGSSGSSGGGSTSSSGGLAGSSSGGLGGSSSGSSGGGSSSSGGLGGSSGSGSSGSSGGGSSSGGGAPVTFTQLYTTIISKSCLPCHSTGGGKTMGMLDMTTQATAYTSLMGAVAGGCMGDGMFVVAGQHAMSLLWKKIQPMPPCGVQMPKTGTLLTAAQIAEFATWIDSGAANN